MECRDAQFYLQFRCPGSTELDPDVATGLDRHLSTCPQCAAEGEFSARFDIAVSAAMRDIPIPPGLRERLVARISEPTHSEGRAMECRDAQFYLQFRRPGSTELDPDVAAGLDRHLHSCPVCAADATFSAQFDSALSDAMRAVAVPPGLREQLVARISARRGTTLRRQAYRVAAMAASLLLAIGIGIGALTAARPVPDTFELTVRGDALAVVMQADAGQRVALQPDAPTDPRLAQVNKDRVQRWLADEGLPTTLPEPFDFGLLLSYHWEPLQGRHVPVILFRERQGPGFAKVYLFRSLAFDLKVVPEAQSSYCEARPYPNRSAGVTFVVVYTGQSLAPFLQGRAEPVAA